MFFFKNSFQILDIRIFLEEKHFSFDFIKIEFHSSAENFSKHVSFETLSEIIGGRVSNYWLP